jgi:biotin transport system substrate-specific component
MKSTRNFDPHQEFCSLEEPFVNKELFATTSPLSQQIELAPSESRASFWMRSAGIVLAGSAFAAVCAHAAVPLFFTPVPLSLAPFAVLVIGLMLSPRLAAATLGAYLLEGAAGLPVFAPSATTGLAHLIGPTGGYLIAYPVAAALIAVLFRRSRRATRTATTNIFVAAALSAAIGSFVILASGATWLSVFTHASLQSSVKLGLLPFLPGDALKVAVAAGIAAGWSRVRRQA